MNEVAVQRLMIEVQVMKIGNKQVTLSMFKQMLQVSQSETIASDGTLKIDPWGYVNYHPDCSRGLHIHVVFANEEGVRKGTIYRSPGDYPFYLKLSHEHSDNLHNVIIGLFILGEIDTLRKGCRYDSHTGPQVAWDDLKGDIWYTDDDPAKRIIEVLTSDNHANEAPEESLRRRYMGEKKLVMPTILDDNGNRVPAGREALISTAIASYKASCTFEKNLMQSYQSIQDRGQLFIAV